MSITCKICNTKFSKIIPWQHLKTHDVSTTEYKEKYGSVYSDETLSKFKNRLPHNKGKKVTDPVVLAKIKTAIERREQRFQNGEFTRGSPKTKDQKIVLSDRQSEFAKKHPEEMRRRTALAVETKKTNGYDFGSPMRGKHQSALSRLVSSETAKANNAAKFATRNEDIVEKSQRLNIEIQNDVSSAVLKLRCKECNTVFQFTRQYFMPAKFKESMCPTCFPRSRPTSNKENEMFEFIKSIIPSAIQSYRSSYHSKEIDVFVPDLNIGFEFNGLFWHSEQVLLSNNRSKTCDRDKLISFKKNGIRIIQIFEDEWDNKQDIVKSRIQNILGTTTSKIYARKCKLREVSSKDASEFCNMYHIMGNGRSNVRIGLYHNDKLVSLMTFTKSNISRRGINWELNRFASIINTTVVGSASKLFNYFLKNYNPTTVISYSDNRWSDGNLYSTLGFVRKSAGTPNYWYVKQNCIFRIHRFNLRKKANERKSVTEFELRDAEGYSRIWDSGSAKWVWTTPI